jgi:uncharacterized protein
MSMEVLKAVVAWQKDLERTDSLDVTFHGGEPLIAGAAFYRRALPLLQDGLSPRHVEISIQSNLWLLDDELCDLFRRYGVAIGTSLDGPREINDRQRGEGYFDRTWSGIVRARERGLRPGCICTFTTRSLPRKEEVFGFFLERELDFSVHPALPSLRRADSGKWALSAEEHGELLTGMLDLYLPAIDRIKIGTLDAMIRSIASSEGGICTFGDCLGSFLAIGPDGGIYPCQRFTGMPEFRLGSVLDGPTLDELERTPVWRLFEDRQRRVKEECRDCAHFEYCRGGCPYNALASNNGSFATLRDPDCGAYRRAFDAIQDRVLSEVFSPANMDAIVEEPEEGAGLLRRGKLIGIMRGDLHPSDILRRARRILIAVALASTRSPLEATRRLGSLVGFRRVDPSDIESLYLGLAAPVRGLNNLYLHVTFACDLQCAHCYAEAGPHREGAMRIDVLERACQEAAALGFRNAVITGGEPLVHQEKDGLLDALARLRRVVKPMATVLRTNLAQELDRETLERIGRSTDRVVVSIDGDRATHDARRGKGSYDSTVGNLRRLARMGGDAELSLAAVLSLEQVVGPPGASVRELAKRLGIDGPRFKPLLPLGRTKATQPDLAQEWSVKKYRIEEAGAYGFSPTASCGLGQSLYVEPDGSTYPCYACRGEGWALGGLGDAGGLKGIVESGKFLELRKHTVDSNRKCGACAFRYLCGGACKAWNRQGRDGRFVPGKPASDLDEAPMDCSALFERARSVYQGAIACLGIGETELRRSELPLPEAGPPWTQRL